MQIHFRDPVTGKVSQFILIMIQIWVTYHSAAVM